MDDCRWWCWCWADAIARFVGTAVIVCRWLVPWTRWLGRLAVCWSRYALSGNNKRRRDYVSTCTCCGGADFDGMAGRWAVVTGCTDGIGKQFALQLADHGINVALVSRNPDKLRTVAEEIDKRHSRTVLTRIVVADFTSHGNPLTETYETVRRGLAGLDVALLINNAGVGYARPERLLDLPPSRSDPAAQGHDLCRDIVECNVLAAVSMCRIAMPLMVDVAVQDREDDGDELSSIATARGGVVINVSSLLAQVPCPLIAVYAATKAFLDKFSVELAAEYGGDAIDAIAVRCLTPGLVSTKMTRIRPTAGHNADMTPVPDASTYARHSLRSLSCHCWCRYRRRFNRQRPNERRNGAADDGWLSAGAMTAVFDSPSSPFSAGHTGTATAGHLFHTLMVRAIILIQWLVGDEIVSRTIRWMLCRNRERIAVKEAEKAKAVAKMVTKEEKETSAILKAQKCT